MNKLQFVFVIYDSVIETYTPPFTSETQGGAVRSFGDACQDPKHPYGQHPEDYTLFQVGEYSTQTGNFEPLKTHVRICQGHELVGVKAVESDPEVPIGQDMFNGKQGMTGAINE